MCVCVCVCDMYMRARSRIMLLRYVREVVYEFRCGTDETDSSARRSAGGMKWRGTLRATENSPLRDPTQHRDRMDRWHSVEQLMTTVVGVVVDVVDRHSSDAEAASRGGRNSSSMIVWRGDVLNSTSVVYLRFLCLWIILIFIVWADIMMIL